MRVGGPGVAGTWLDSVTPALIEYVPGTGIVHLMRMMGALQIDEYELAPMGLTENASLMLVKVTALGSAGAVDVYSIFNYHLGSGSPTPGSDSETISYAGAPYDALYESGPSGVAFGYASIPASSHHGSAPSANANSPYDLLTAGSDLDDDAGTGGAVTDAIAGFQSSLGTLAIGSSAWAGWFTVLAPDANAQNAVERVRTWIDSRTPEQLLTDETSNWHAWLKPAPSGASAAEAAQAAQAQVVLRMGQVAETGAANGQILASIAPGMWNIAWVRDMAYATVGLIRSGHLTEAKAAIEFQMNAQVGGYESYVGVPYQISVVRYYGNGTEWSDSNSDGPNVEFDGFGLFLWELDEYMKASNDTAALAALWPAVKSKVADVLVHLQEPSGLIAADSSIWEVHWNGQQRHFTYTTITAANGLCAASHLATLAADSASAAKYLTAGQTARDALILNDRAADGTLGQSTEALGIGSGWLDAATMEAIGLGLIDPMKPTATATLRAIELGLTPQSGRGFMRSNTGDDYSSHEWVFVDLRAARALELAGDATMSASLFAWNLAQGGLNFGELSELHDPVTADYAGQSPMVGFGAGAYLLRLFDRGKPASASCGSFAVEPELATDGGASDGATDGGTKSGSHGEMCSRAALAGTSMLAPIVLLALCLLLRRRRLG